MNRDFVIASEARQSMQPEVMDCVTAFAMTATANPISEKHHVHKNPDRQSR
jgi:hypothetical protein